MLYPTELRARRAPFSHLASSPRRCQMRSLPFLRTECTANKWRLCQVRPTALAAERSAEVARGSASGQASTHKASLSVAPGQETVGGTRESATVKLALTVQARPRSPAGHYCRSAQARGATCSAAPSRTGARVDHWNRLSRLRIRSVDKSREMPPLIRFASSARRAARTAAPPS